MQSTSFAARAAAVACGIAGSACFTFACGGGGGASPHGTVDAATDSAAETVEAGPDGPGADSGSAVGDSGPSDAGPTPDAASDSGFVTATHGSLQVPNNGGPVMAHPELVTITFADDSERSWAETIGGYLVTSPWLQAVGPQYGIGTGTHVAVELTEDAPSAIDDDQVQAFLATLILDGTLPAPTGGPTIPVEPGTPFGQLDAGIPVDAGGFDAGAVGTGGTTATLLPAIYMLYIPTQTSLTVEGEAFCDYSGGGYHYLSYGSFAGITFAYAVVGLCPMMAMSTLEMAVSHEFIEAATDPAYTQNGWAITDQNQVWSTLGGEVGDLCAFVAPQWAEGNYTSLQRVYSNQSAASGGDPCLPEPAPYYAADVEPQTWVPLSAGATTTFDITGWSTAPVQTWSLSQQPYTASPASLTPSAVLSTGMLNNGQSATLQVTMPAGTPSGSYAILAIGSADSQTSYEYSLAGVYVP